MFFFVGVLVAGVSVAGVSVAGVTVVSVVGVSVAVWFLLPESVAGVSVTVVVVVSFVGFLWFLLARCGCRCSVLLPVTPPLFFVVSRFRSEGQ